MKSSKRLDYAIFAEVLGQRGLIDRQRLSLALQTSQQGIIPLPEMLIGDNLIGDWELSNVVCDLYGLPFLPTEFYQPSEDALEGLDASFVRQHRLVPMARFGTVLVVAMPGLVSADVLVQLEEMSNLKVLPVVGTVQSNNRWLQEFLPAEAKAAATEEDADDWGSLFDVGDAAVLLDLEDSMASTDLAGFALEIDAALPSPVFDPISSGTGAGEEIEVSAPTSEEDTTADVTAAPEAGSERVAEAPLDLSIDLTAMPASDPEPEPEPDLGPEPPPMLGEDSAPAA